MDDSKIIEEVIRKILEDSSIAVRNFKGYGSSHVIADRKPFFLGTSPVEDLINKEDVDKKRKDISFEKVKISRAFKRRS